MKKIIKSILISITIIIVVISSLAILLVTTVNQDTIKNKIVQLVHDKTGKDLSINGAMHWSFFPWFGVNVQDVTFNNFVKIAEIDVNVKLLPLLSRRIEAGSINIYNGNISWKDNQTNKKIEINKLDLHCKNVNLNEPFAIKTNFYLSSTNPSLNGEFKIDSQIKLDITNKKYTLNNLHLIGKIKNQALDQPLYFESDANIEIDFKAAALSDFLAAIKLTGNIKSSEIKIKKLNFTNFYTNIAGKNGLINFAKLRADFYHGTINGNVDIDMHGTAPKLNLKLIVANAALQPLLTDFAAFNKFSGILSINTNISTHGKTSEAMLNSLNGTGKVSINNGSYLGIDIPYEVRRASAIINQKPMPIKSEPTRTDFDQLTMSFKINNALLNTDDFLIQAPDYKVTGNGTANLVSQLLDLHLAAYSTHDENFFVPIKVTGSFNNPSIKPDVNAIVKQQATKAVKRVIEKQLEKIKIPQKLMDVLPINKLIN